MKAYSKCLKNASFDLRAFPSLLKLSRMAIRIYKLDFYLTSGTCQLSIKKILNERSEILPAFLYGWTNSFGFDTV